MNHGVVIKTNANQRYTSNAPTTFLLRRVAKKAGVKVQDFEIRNDSVCPPFLLDSHSLHFYFFINPPLSHILDHLMISLMKMKIHDKDCIDDDEDTG